MEGPSGVIVNNDVCFWVGIFNVSARFQSYVSAKFQPFGTSNSFVMQQLGYGPFANIIDDSRGTGSGCRLYRIGQ